MWRVRIFDFVGGKVYGAVILENSVKFIVILWFSYFIFR